MIRLLPKATKKHISIIRLFIRLFGLFFVAFILLTLLSFTPESISKEDIPRFILFGTMTLGFVIVWFWEFIGTAIILLSFMAFVTITNIDWNFIFIIIPIISFLHFYCFFADRSNKRK